MNKWCSACNDERKGKFCLDCGTLLTYKFIVCDCGTHNSDKANFCQKCGKSVLQNELNYDDSAQTHNLTCSHCGSLQNDDCWNFCCLCGERNAIETPSKKQVRMLSVSNSTQKYQSLFNRMLPMIRNT